MSRQKLTIVVTCTHIKSTTPADALMARSLPVGEVEARARAWAAAMADARPVAPLVDLYRGGTWAQARRLFATAEQLGYEPDIFVASAGLGLRNLNANAASYAATFHAGLADSVAHSTLEARAWWRTLPHERTPQGGRALWVLSESYSRVIGDDLLERTKPDDLLVFGGSREIPRGLRVESDRDLRRALGGTVTSLNLRAATKWLELTQSVGPFSTEAHTVWHEWSEASRHRETYNRTPMSDSEVLQYVDTIRAAEPGISKTRALTFLRGSGRACEQQRFSQLFKQETAR